MEEIIKNFPNQFKYEPIIENKENLKEFSKVIISGMGGSNLASELLKNYGHNREIIINRDYGLPDINDSAIKDCLILASSYSGNTEETIDSFNLAVSKGLNIAVITTGGELLKLAQSSGAPHIRLSDTGIEPRLALGFSLRAIMKLIGDENGLKETGELPNLLDLDKTKKEGEFISESLKSFIPVIYSSAKNAAISRIWKIKFNETAKIPAFSNVFPELNHNEMTGFDIKDSTKNLSQNFKFIFLEDNEDGDKIKNRMAVTRKMLEDRGLGVLVSEFSGQSKWDKIFNSLLVADWSSFDLAKFYGNEPEKVPMVEEFKKLIRKSL